MSFYRYQHLAIRDGGDVATVTIFDADGTRHSQDVPPDHRQDLAGMLAGDEYWIIPANVRHGCQWTDDPGDPCPVCGQKLPEWERELLAREALAAQPDRPEPVHEDDLRVGDEVEATLTGKIEAIEDGCPFLVHVDGSRTSIAGAYGGAAFRVLRRAKREPDEAAVEALARMIHGCGDIIRSEAERLARELVKHGVEVPHA